VIAVAEGYMAWLDIRSRSGLAKDAGLFCITGTIDQDYRGEICVVLANISNRIFTCPKGTKIAQMVLNVTPKVEGLDAITIKKIRGANGFGSTDQQNV
jgi:dUTP pyrophosphatase